MVGGIDAVVLCGGQGKRLRDVVADTQKVMAQIDGRPFLDILLEHLRKQGIQRVVLCTGYKADSLERYYREDSRGLAIEFSREETPLGTGGALKNARYFINSDPFFVFNGDSYCPVALEAFLEFHKSKRARASLAVSRADEAEDFGSMTLDKFCRITGFQEKTKEQASRYVNAGVYCFNEDVFSLMPPEERFSLEYDFFPALVDKGFYGYCTEEKFFDIGTPQRYSKAQQLFSKGRSS